METHVYSPSAGCVQCNGTKNALTKRGVEWQGHIGDEDDDLLNAIKERTDKLDGNSWPLVQVFDDGHKLVDEWQGYRPDKINAIFGDGRD